MYYDLHNNTHRVKCISPVAAGTTGTGKTGDAIDTQGYGGVEFLLGYGTVTSTAATVTVTVMHSDTATAGDFTSVADTFLIGTESDAGLAAGTRTSGSTKNVVKGIGYVPQKRYCKVKMVNTATAGVIIDATAVLFSPRSAPTS